MNRLCMYQYKGVLISEQNNVIVKHLSLVLLLALSG